MSFKPYVHEGKTIGFAMNVGRAFFFFGTRFFPRVDHSKIFPQYRFAYLKQVHGKAVLAASAAAVNEGDGHFTSEPGLALVSQTADCTPILLANDSVVCALHSGWRGTELTIAGAAKAVFSSPPEIAAIGPHIMKRGFEVGLDVAERLEKAPSGSQLSLPHPDPAKKYFDLTEMARRQLRAAFGPDLKIHECLEDTVTNELFHSYRREKQQADRQFSFVVLNR
jgi:YfiH family protein